MTRVERIITPDPKPRRWFKRAWWPRSGFTRRIVVGAVTLSVLIVLGVQYGMIHLPWLSEWLYQPLEPVRRVAVLSPSESDFLAKIQVVMSKPTSPRLQFSESEITSSYQWITKGATAVRGLQTVVLPSGLEISGRLAPGNEFYRFRVEASPEVYEGRLRLRATGSRFQGIPLGAGLSQPLLDGLAAMFNRQLPKELRLTEVQLSDGELELLGDWTGISRN